MLVHQWMNRQPLFVSPIDRLTAAAELMAQKRLRHLLVIEDGRLCGILARSDVLRAAPAGSNPFSAVIAPEAFAATVREAMSTAIVTVAPDLPIEDAARLMSEQKIGILPVLSGSQTIGVVTRSDLFRAFIAMLGEGQDGIRLSFDITDTEDAVAFAVALARRHGMKVASVSTFDRDGRRSAVVRLAGHEPPGMIEELWKTGHRVLSVTRPSGPPRPMTG